MSTPLSVGAAVFLVAMTSWTAATQDSTAWMWIWAMAGPAYVVVWTSLTYWWVRRWLAPQASPGVYEATGANPFGLITESPRGRGIVPWSRVTGVRVRRDIVKLTFADPTLIAGTRLSGQIRVTHASPVEYALLSDILKHLATHGHLGGRTAAGHGRIHAAHTTTVTAGAPAESGWRAAVVAGRDGAITALNTLT